VAGTPKGKSKCRRAVQVGFHGKGTYPLSRLIGWIWIEPTALLLLWTEGIYLFAHSTNNRAHKISTSFKSLGFFPTRHVAEHYLRVQFPLPARSQRFIENEPAAMIPASSCERTSTFIFFFHSIPFSPPVLPASSECSFSPSITS
jgi:hypothetical protein